MIRPRRTLVFALCLALPVALEESSSGRVAATSSATAAQGKLEIRGVTGHARHMHGGPRRSSVTLASSSRLRSPSARGRVAPKIGRDPAR